MGYIDGPAVDWRNKILKTLRPERDIPACFGWWDFSTVSGADGDGIRVVRDRSGFNNDAIMQIVANRPTLKLNQKNGLSIARYTATKVLATSGTTWKQPAKAQPISYVALAKTSDVSTVAKTIIQSTGGTFTGLGIYGSTALTGVAYPFAGAAGIGSGAPITDGNWHVIIAVLGANSTSVFVDGYLVASANTQSQGTNTATGALWIGSTSSTGGFTGDLAEVMAFNTELTLAQVKSVTDYLNVKWALGLTVPAAESVTWYDANDSTGQSVRYFVPNQLGATAPLVVFNHQQGGTNALTPGAAAWYNIVHALVEAGYIVAMPTNHGTDGWTSDLSSQDGANVVTYVEANIVPVDRIVVVGMSMGGGLAAQQAKDGKYGTKLKGVYIVDGGLNLGELNKVLPTSIGPAFSVVTGTNTVAITAGATSFTSSVSFAAGTKVLVDRGANPEIVTVAPAGPTGAGPYVIPITGTFSFAHAVSKDVSDYPTKTAGHDPVLYTAGQLPTGKRWRFVASPIDTLAVKTLNVDIFKPVVDTLASPLESDVVTHPTTHLGVGAWIPQDVVAFANRSV